MILGHNVETSGNKFEFARYVHHTWQYGNVWAVGITVWSAPAFECLQRMSCCCITTSAFTMTLPQTIHLVVD
jgi:hypothetical protein